MTLASPPADEHPTLRILRRLVGIGLCLVAGIIGLFGGVAAVLVPLIGAIAYLGGGDASDEQVGQGWAIIFLMAVAPILATALMAWAAVSLLQRKRPWLIIIVCCLSVAGQAGLHVWGDVRLNMTALLVLLTQLAAVAVSFTIKKVTVQP